MRMNVRPRWGIGCLAVTLVDCPNPANRECFVMADQLVLNAEFHTERGSRANRRLRRGGKIPAVVYGLTADPTAIAVDYRETRMVLSGDAGLNALVELHVPGKDMQLVLVKELQRHAVKDEVIHIDFIRVDADQEIEVDVPVILIGEAREVSQEGGMVDQIVHSLAVYSKPTAIPNELEVDISGIEIGTSIYVGDIVLPEGVRTEVDPEESVAIGTVTRSTLEAMREEEEAEAAAEAEGEGGDAAAAGEAEGGDEG